MSAATQNMTENVQVNFKDWKTILGNDKEKLSLVRRLGSGDSSNDPKFFDRKEPQEKISIIQNVMDVLMVSRVSTRSCILQFNTQRNYIPGLRLDIRLGSIRLYKISHSKFHQNRD